MHLHDALPLLPAAGLPGVTQAQGWIFGGGVRALALAPQDPAPQGAVLPSGQAPLQAGEALLRKEQEYGIIGHSVLSILFMP